MHQLFQYAAILQPKTTKDGVVTEPGAVIVEPTSVIAKDAEQATLLAARSIPEEHLDKLDRISLAVRPF